MSNEKSLRETIDRLNNKIVKGQDIAHELKQDVERVEAQVKRRDGVITEQGEKIKELEEDYACRLRGMDVLRECNNKLEDDKEKNDDELNKTIVRKDTKIRELQMQITSLESKIRHDNTTVLVKSQTKKYKDLQKERDLLRDKNYALMEVNRNLRKYADAITDEKNHKIDSLKQDKKDLKDEINTAACKGIKPSLTDTLPDPSTFINYPMHLQDPKNDPNGNWTNEGGDDYSDCVWEDRLTNWNNNKFQPFFYRVDLEFKKRYNETHYPIKMEELRKGFTTSDYLSGPSFVASHEKQWMALRADKTNADFRELEDSKELTEKELEELTKTYNEALYKIEGLTEALKETVRIQASKK